MFHKFSATPRSRLFSGQIQGPGPARVNNDAHGKSRESKSIPLMKRRKVARACNRCRLQRLRCDEQKPCAPCVDAREECVVSQAVPRASQANGNHADPVMRESVSGFPPRTPSLSSHEEIISHNHDFTPTGSSFPLFPTSISQEGSQVTEIPSVNVPKDHFSLAHAQGFFALDQKGVSDGPAYCGCFFPQLPHPTIPSGESLIVSDVLSNSHRNYYIWLFWDACHPLLQIMTKAEFSDLTAVPASAVADGLTVKSALVDSMIALGMQHSDATGRSGRVVGLQHLPPSRTIWPGFEYFHRCRECMRNTSEVTLDVLRCHILLVIYLMKGNAVLDAYNLIGIAVRKAYIIKLHRQPPNSLSEAEKTARMQVWWMLFTLDLHCALQLDMPPAIQKSLVQCPFPTEHDLARYVSSSGHNEEGTKGYICSNLFVNFVVILTHINACVSETTLSDNNSNDPAALENHGQAVLSALQTLDAWRESIPQDLLLCRCTGFPNNTEIFSFERALLLPEWLLRQAVILELHYHNAYILIQRPFLRHCPIDHTNAGDTVKAAGSRTTSVELHVSGSLHHATAIVEMLLVVSSMSDVLYGWSEALQPLWNATLTIMAHIATKSTSPLHPKIRDSLAHANDLFRLFAPSCATARAAQSIVQSLISSIYNEPSQTPPVLNRDELMDWNLFSSLFEDQTFFDWSWNYPFNERSIG